MPREAGKDAESPRRKLRALVIDDAPDITTMLHLLLKNAGYEVTEAHSGSEAAEAAERERFDVIISDIGLPGMDGYQLLDYLRSIPRYAETPVVAITGYARHSDTKEAMGRGFNAHLTKPINPLNLLTLLEELCR